MTHGGKGSRPRPYSVTQQEYDTRWDAIFGRDLERESALEKLGVDIDTEIFPETSVDTDVNDK
jgi:hypothetical protein